MFEAGWQCCHLGRYEEAPGRLEESLAIARELGDRSVARVLQPLGLAAFGRGDVDASRTYMEEAADLARESATSASWPRR
ncbi:MAG: tetratricopeptide repeat protein [Betaproteobacteria bacterium]|nr:tetratricopeptide repeat protein [Betaproteobacteria bacterium]